MGRMILRIKKKGNNRVFIVYLVAMFTLMVLRYLFNLDIPSILFLGAAMLPIWFGSVSEQLAFVATCIPLSVAFQYKYALLILAVAIVVRRKFQIRISKILLIVVLMMVWEFWHAVYGYFSPVEFVRGFAELILLGIITSIDMKNINQRLIIRSLSISVVGVCAIMLIMQMQQHDYNIITVLARSARNYRFGESNMESGAFALNFNANNLGFICNLSACGSLLLISRKEHKKWDIAMVIASFIFAGMTLSRAAIICSLMVYVLYLYSAEKRIDKKLITSVVGMLIAIVILALLWSTVPMIFENLQERFQRKDVWNGRGSLFRYYGEFLLSSPLYFWFGIGMQHIFEKVRPVVPVHDVPHLGLQEVCVAWGMIGVVMMLFIIYKIMTTSKLHTKTKRQTYQFVPLLLILVFTMTGQLLTSSRALMALTFAYSCLSVTNNK